jgi:ribosomal protein L11 methylase PrmA
MIVANIQLEVLIANASALSRQLAKRGRLVLSGLAGTDVPSILAEYRPRLPSHRAEVYPRGEWSAVVFSPA